MEKNSKKSKKVPMDERAIRALAALVDGATPETFDAALTAMVDGLKPRILEEWKRRQAMKNIARVARPIKDALEAGQNAEDVARALLEDSNAVEVFQQMGK